MNITHEFTKHALAIEVERSKTGDDIVTVLDRLIIIHRTPDFVRMDNGTEITSHTLLETKIMAEDYRQHHNTHRPHCSLGYLTPDEFALQRHNTNPGLTKSLAHKPGQVGLLHG